MSDGEMIGSEKFQQLFESMEAMRPGLSADLDAVPRFRDFMKTGYESLDGSEAITLALTTDTSDWFSDNCGQFRSMLGEFMHGAIDEARILHGGDLDSWLLQRDRDRATERTEITLVMSAESVQWLRATADERRITVNDLTEMCLDARKREIEANPEYVPREIQLYREAAKGVGELVRSGKFAESSRRFRSRRIA